MFKDTYFLDANEALRVAKEQNKIDFHTLQICYYNGEKIESEYKNLVHLPIGDMVNTLALGTYRLPSELSFEGLDISQEIKNDILQNFDLSLNQAKSIRDELNMYFSMGLKGAKPDFSEPLRIYLGASAHTQVMQYVSKNIADTFKDMGYDVLFELDYGMKDYSSFKAIKEFNPHIIVSINHLNNSFISDDVFNFIWFQDPMPFLLDKTRVKTRDRDYVFSLVPIIDNLLEIKEIKFQRQGFCVNSKDYYLNNEIKREKKIVFIGSSYIDTIQGQYGNRVPKAITELSKIFSSGGSFTKKVVKDISSRHKLDSTFVETRLIPYIIRDASLLKLCSLNTEFDIEVYGAGWEAYEEIKPYYKGVLKYGEEITKVYNSATYAFCPHQQYTLQQRVFESSSCGAIPIVYDCRDISEEESYDESLCYFKTFEELENLLKQDIPKKDFSNLLQNHSYESFAKKIVEIVKENK